MTQLTFSMERAEASRSAQSAFETRRLASPHAGRTALAKHAAVGRVRHELPLRRQR